MCVCAHGCNHGCGTGPDLAYVGNMSGRLFPATELTNRAFRGVCIFSDSTKLGQGVVCMRLPYRELQRVCFLSVPRKFLGERKQTKANQSKPNPKRS